MSVIVALAAQVLHIALVVLAAPAIEGAVNWLEARLAGRSSPPLMQPCRDLIRLVRKTAVLPESASRALLFAPVVSLGATLAAASLVPSFTLGAALAPLADGLVVASLLSIGRVAAILGALDTGSALPGVAAQSSTALSVLSEPALLLFVFSLALMGGSFNLDLIIGQQHDGTLVPAAASALALTSLLALALTDTGDATAGLDPDLSGIDLAVARFTLWLRRLVWIDLIGGLFVPIGLAAVDGGLRAWAFGMACWATKLAVAIIALGVVRTVLCRVGKPAMLDLVGIAGLLALLATLLALTNAATT